MSVPVEVELELAALIRPEDVLAALTRGARELTDDQLSELMQLYTQIKKNPRAELSLMGKLEEGKVDAEEVRDALAIGLIERLARVLQSPTDRVAAVEFLDTTAPYKTMPPLILFTAPETWEGAYRIMPMIAKMPPARRVHFD